MPETSNNPRPGVGPATGGSTAPTPTDERIDDLIDSLDDIARDVDHYEFGLPMVSHMEQMRAVVRVWLEGL